MRKKVATELETTLVQENSERPPFEIVIAVKSLFLPVSLSELEQCPLFKKIDVWQTSFPLFDERGELILKKDLAHKTKSDG